MGVWHTAENSLRKLDLERFFAPRSLVLYGASETPGNAGAGMTRFMLKWAEHQGDVDVYLVNPNRDQVMGRPCVASMDDVPVGVDLCAILVSNVLPAVRATVERLVHYVLVFGAGFNEAGAEGRTSQRELEQLIHGSATRLFGPNTVLNAFDIRDGQLLHDQRGIGLITQSGHQGRPVFQTQENGTALAYWATTGNEADVEFADLARFYAQRPEVGVITAYVEGFRDGHTMLQAADHAARSRTPIVMVKVGRTAAGSAMAMSHTGKLTGNDAVSNGAFRQSGVVRVDDIDELIEVSQLFARATPPAGDGVCLYSISGGTGAHLADICSAAGLRLARLSPSTQQQLHEWIPSNLDVSNPVDSGGHPTGDERGIKILETLVADPDVAVLICAITGATPPMSDVFAADLAKIAETTDKPICVIWSSPVGTEPAYRETLLASHRVIVFRNFRNCARAVAEYVNYHRFVDSYASPFGQIISVKAADDARERSTSILSEREHLTEVDAKELLAAYGVSISRDAVALCVNDAVDAAQRIGFPVVMKGVHGSATHKSELGLVRLGVNSPDGVRRVFHELHQTMQSLDPLGPAEGVLVSEQVESGAEMIVGVTTDPVFGNAVMVGAGGTEAELIRDVQFRVPPFSRSEAWRMVKDLQFFPLLDGFRGRNHLDIESLVDVIMSFQQLAVDLEGLVDSVEANPVIVSQHGAIAVDALVVPLRQTN